MVEQQRSSGLSVARFCREQQIGESSLFAWKRRLARETQAARPAFVLLRPASARPSGDRPEASGSAIELHLGPSRHLVLRPGFDAETLRAVLAVLEGEDSLREGR